MKEIWGKPFRSIFGNLLLEISNLDKVRTTNLKTGKVKYPKIYFDKNIGYKRFSINFGKRKSFLLHRIKAETFLSIPDNFSLKELIVHHKDNNTLNNDISNLEWMLRNVHASQRIVSDYERKVKAERWKGNKICLGKSHSKETKKIMSQKATIFPIEEFYFLEKMHKELVLAGWTATKAYEQLALENDISKNTLKKKILKIRRT